MKIGKQDTMLAVLIVILMMVTAYRVLLRPTGVLRSVSAVEAHAVGVYWNKECTNATTSISWGAFVPGGSKVFNIYVRNENASTIRFLLTKMENCSPADASKRFRLALICANEKIAQNEVTPATITLHVRENAAGISNFTFNIVFYASQYFAGDANHDGNVDPTDMALLVASYGSTPEKPNWNLQADFDESGKVDAYDLALLIRNYGKHG